MPAGRRPAVPPPAVTDGTLAIVSCLEPFTLVPGHRLRGASCLICQLAIGGQTATIIGVAGLGGDACTCGAVVSDTFLIHARHLPVSAGRLETALRRGLQCGREHLITE